MRSRSALSRACAMTTAAAAASDAPGRAGALELGRLAMGAGTITTDASALVADGVGFECALAISRMARSSRQLCVSRNSAALVAGVEDGTDRRWPGVGAPLGAAMSVALGGASLNARNPAVDGAAAVAAAVLTGGSGAATLMCAAACGGDNTDVKSSEYIAAG